MSVKAGSSQQTRHVNPMLVECWASVLDVGPILQQHWVDISCLLGHLIQTDTREILPETLIISTS